MEVVDCSFKLQQNCRKIECKAYPEDATCEVVEPEDKTFPRPSGPNAECCPLWKCWRNGDMKNIFTFHGNALLFMSCGKFMKMR
jgi:hypothetical protein